MKGREHEFQNCLNSIAITIRYAKALQMRIV